MKSDILKRLSYCLIFSLVISLIFYWTNYQSTEGFEAKQGSFLLVIVSIIYCFINFFASLTAFLNLNLKVRENIFLSTISFFGIPIIILLWTFTDILTKKNDNETIQSYLFLIMPSISYILSLTYHFIKFRVNLKLN